MQLDIIYYRYKGLLKYLFFNQITGVGIFLQSSGSYFCPFKSEYKNMKAYLFDKYFEIAEIQTLPVDYDIYVKVAQSCMIKAGMKRSQIGKADTSGAEQTYLTIVEHLRLDRDYTHIKPLSSKQIAELSPKKVKKYFSSIISNIRL